MEFVLMFKDALSREMQKKILLSEEIAVVRRCKIRVVIDHPDVVNLAITKKSVLADEDISAAITNFITHFGGQDGNFLCYLGVCFFARSKEAKARCRHIVRHHLNDFFAEKYTHAPFHEGEIGYLPFSYGSCSGNYEDSEGEPSVFINNREGNIPLSLLAAEINELVRHMLAAYKEIIG